MRFKVEAFVELDHLEELEKVAMELAKEFVFVQLLWKCMNVGCHV